MTTPACTPWPTAPTTTPSTRRLPAIARRFRDALDLFIRFQHGSAVAPLSIVGPGAALPPDGKRTGRKTGTEITFLPITKTCAKVVFYFATLEHRIRELAFLNSGVVMT